MKKKKEKKEKPAKNRHEEEKTISFDALMKGVMAAKSQRKR
jgi:hypothetical protein